jgi:uroporphyrinogen-III synthase
MEGFRVGVTAARRGQSLVDALERRGATVLWGPTLQGDRTDEHAALELGRLLDHRPAWVVASTGVGVGALHDTAIACGQEDALRERLCAARLVARGAKAHGALRALGLAPVFVSSQETDADTSAWLARHVLAGERVGVLLHGGGDRGAYREVAAAGADVATILPYRSLPPEDTTGAHALIEAACAGGLDAVTCTSPGAFRNLVAIAATAGREAELLRALSASTAVAAVGPVTARAVEECGVPVSIMPLRHRAADLVRALEAFAARGCCGAGPLRIGAAPRTVEVAGRTLELGALEHDLLAALVRRRGVVCPVDVLAVEMWGHAAPRDPAAVKHQVSRVRRKLGEHGRSIQTVRGVGYRYAP